MNVAAITAGGPCGSGQTHHRIGALELLSGAVTAALTLVVGLSQGSELSLVKAGIAGVLGLLAASDLRSGIIPNRLIYPALAVAIVASLFRPDISLMAAVGGMGVAAMPFLVLFLAAPGSIGGGDVKMAALVGAMLGSPAAFGAITAAAIGGGVIAAAIVCRHRERGASIRYGPFLAAGAVFVML